MGELAERIGCAAAVRALPTRAPALRAFRMRPASFASLPWHLLLPPTPQGVDLRKKCPERGAPLSRDPCDLHNVPGILPELPCNAGDLLTYTVFLIALCALQKHHVERKI